MNDINVLDFDGVNNSVNFEDLHKNVIYHGQPIHNQYILDLAKNINDICLKFDFKLVISSTWRKITLRDILKNQMIIQAEIIDYTTMDYLGTGFLDILMRK